MTWPWVSRTAYLEARHLADTWHECWVEEVAGSRRLTDIIVEMRREGFNPEPPSGAVVAEPDLPETVMRAIEARANPNSETYRVLVRGARAALTPDHGNSEDVAQLIYRGAGNEEDE